MKQIDNYIIEKLHIDKDKKFPSKLDLEMEEWDQRMKEPFGKALKDLQKIFVDQGLYATEKDEYGLDVYTPFDNYITAYALDGNKEYTYNHIKAICDDWEYTYNHPDVKKQLAKIKRLINK